MHTSTPDGYGFYAELAPSRREIELLTRCLAGNHSDPWRHLGALGHRTVLGRRYAHCWTQYRTPAGYLGMKEFIGTRLLLDTAATYGLLESNPPIESALVNRSPVRYIRRRLLADLLLADAVVPWPTMQAPFPELLVMLPRDGCWASVQGQQPDAVAALLIRCRDGQGGLELEWSAYGWRGSFWADGWSVKPLVQQPISRLAWAVAALLQGEASGEAEGVRRATGREAQAAQGDLPVTPWLEVPRIRHRRPTEASQLGGPSRIPHWRRAHPHRFWTGSRRGVRSLIIRWVPAVWVSGDSDS